MAKLLLIAGGGALGAVLRYVVAGAVQGVSATGFPTGTLVVNIVGCLAIGLLGGFALGPTLVPKEWHFFAIIGLLGAFTTFSTYGWETIGLLNDSQFARAALNVSLGNIGGLAAVWLGLRLAGHFFGP